MTLLLIFGTISLFVLLTLYSLQEKGSFERREKRIRLSPRGFAGNLLLGGGVALVVGGVLWSVFWLAFLFLLVLLLRPPSVESMPPFWFRTSIYAPGAILLGGALLFLLRRGIQRGKKARLKLHEKLESESHWKLLKDRYETGEVEEARRSMRLLLQSLPSSNLVAGATLAAEGLLSEMLSSPAKYFAPDTGRLRMQIATFLRSDSWDSLKQNYDPEHVDAMLGRFQERYGALETGGWREADRARELIEEIERVMRHPEAHLDSPLPIARKTIAKFLENDTQWQKWTDSFDPDKTHHMRQKIRGRLGNIEGEKDPTRARRLATETIRELIRPLLANPGKLLRRDLPIEDTESPDSGFLQGSETGSIFGGSGTGGESDGDGGASQGEGGSFGGGGASDSW